MFSLLRYLSLQGCIILLSSPARALSTHDGFADPPMSVLEGASARSEQGDFRYYCLDNTIPQGVLRVNRHAVHQKHWRKNPVFVGNPVQILRFVYPCTEADGFGRWELVKDSIEKLLLSLKGDEVSSHVKTASEWLFSSAPTKVITVVGPIGSGKSTLLNNYRQTVSGCDLDQDWQNEKMKFQTGYGKLGKKGDDKTKHRERSLRFLTGENTTKGVWAGLIRDEFQATWVLDTPGMNSPEGGPRVSFFRDASLLTILNALSDRILFVSRGRLSGNDISYFDQTARAAAIYSKRLELSSSNEKGLTLESENLIRM